MSKACLEIKSCARDRGFARQDCGAVDTTSGSIPSVPASACAAPGSMA